MSPTLVYQLFRGGIVPMWEFTKSLFHWLPTILNQSQVWRIVTIEIGFKAILLFLFAHNVRLPRSVPRISILL